MCQGLRRYEVVSTDHLFGNIPEENFLLYPVAWWWWEVVTVSLLCCLQNRGISVSEAVNRNAQYYRGEVCIFNVLYQIDVFLGYDDGITTEAVHNPIKCTVAFRRVQYTDWKQRWYRRNCLSWFIKVGGEYNCAEAMFLYTLVYSPHLNIIWRTYWQNCRESGRNCSGLMFWLFWITDRFYVVIFNGANSVREKEVML